MPKTRQWRCKDCNAILGMITYNDSDVPQLELLRNAIDMNADMPAQVDVFGALVGYMPVMCECGTVNIWEISVDGLMYQFSLLNDEQLLQLLQKLRKRIMK